jgi:hypothetical protein
MPSSGEICSVKFGSPRTRSTGHKLKSQLKTSSFLENCHTRHLLLGGADQTRGDRGQR